MGQAEEAQYITEEYLAELEAEMLAAAEELEFERAAAIRDRIGQMRRQLGKPLAEAEIHHATRTERGRHRNQPSQAAGAETEVRTLTCHVNTELCRHQVVVVMGGSIAASLTDDIKQLVGLAALDPPYKSGAL